MRNLKKCSGQAWRDDEKAKQLYHYKEHFLSTFISSSKAQLVQRLLGFKRLCDWDWRAVPARGRWVNVSKQTDNAFLSLSLSRSLDQKSKGEWIQCSKGVKRRSQMDERAVPVRSPTPYTCHEERADEWREADTGLEVEGEDSMEKRVHR